jgi:nucleoside-diphosphate-sugar epimerase
MKIFVAGATGAVGKRLVPQLVERGHEVTGTTRNDDKLDLIRGLGATPVVADGLDPEAVAQAVAGAEPDVIVHQMTALTSLDLRKFEQSFAVTDRLRTEGTDHLLSAARAVGVKRFVAQGYAGWSYARDGTAAKSEEASRDPAPPAPLHGLQAALEHVEAAVTGADWTEGIVLRYGNFYGPGTNLEYPDGEMNAQIRQRKVPVIGDGAGVWSFVHIDDAAAATVAAIERGRRGIYNVVDDEPATTAEWLSALAEQLGAKPPRRVPRWLARILAGEAAVVMMTEVHGALNGKAKRELGWEPAYPTWRQGFARGVA